MGFTIPSDSDMSAKTDQDDSSIAKDGGSSNSKGSSLHDGVTERSPLLRGQVIELPSRRPQWMSRSALTIILTLVVGLLASGDQLMDSPQTRIIESVICYRYYERVDPSKIQVGRDAVGPGAGGGVAEMWCKADGVQEQLAMLRGYQQLFDGFPALLLAVPFGWAADRYGRKPFLMLGLISFVFRASWIQFITWFWQAFDIRLTWLSALHGLISGSSPVVSALFFVVLSDITSEAERAAVFLRIGATELLANLTMPPLSAWLMDINPWIPSLCGTLIMCMCIFLFAVVPETLNYKHPYGSPSSSHPPSPSAETAPLPPPDMSVRNPISADFTTRWIGTVKDATAFLTRDWRVTALILPFFGHMLIGNATQLLLQYLSKRYEVTFSKATLLLTIYNAVRVLLLFVVLPHLSTAVMRIFHLTGQKKDLYLARASILFIIAGWTLVGLAPNIPTVAISMAVASLGQGTYLLVRSFLTSLVPVHHIARVYSIISVVDTLGAMFGGALLAGLFKRGIALGGTWIGLPFFFLGLISAAFAVLMFVVRLREGEGELLADEQEM
ncbi:hypothetical protein LTR85_007710 [Meristemomyces frigidus]|nr:hypothetical protein LTR85_007710 [Meristemomyces frigidus]